MSAAAVALVLLVAAQRGAELLVARRNTRALLAAGAAEHGAGHYPLIVLLHGAWLATLLALAARGAPVIWPLAVLYLALQPVRYWILRSLGRRWTTRVIVPPGEPPVTVGPYRWVSHPNYLLVAVEIPLLPLALGAPGVAALFGALNLAVLAWRVRVEGRALAAGAAPV